MKNHSRDLVQVLLHLSRSTFICWLPSQLAENLLNSAFWCSWGEVDAQNCGSQVRPVLYVRSRLPVACRPLSSASGTGALASCVWGASLSVRRRLQHPVRQLKTKICSIGIVQQGSMIARALTNKASPSSNPTLCRTCP